MQLKTRPDIKMRPDIMTGYYETRTSFSPPLSGIGLWALVSGLLSFFSALRFKVRRNACRFSFPKLPRGRIKQVQAA